ncbi:MAG: glycosyltransferase [Bacteroidota bacterium]|nr:glycosyltransferase [Bacteroidota bacterium]
MTTPQGTISVIVTNYNHGRYLERRLESVHAQTATPAEVFVIDDGSTDESWEIITRWCGRCREWKCSRNAERFGSPYLFWDTAIREAKGEYIWIAESDDDASPEFLRESKSMLDENRELSFVFCKSELIDEHGDTMGIAQENVKLSPKEDFRRPFILDGNTALRRHLSKENVVQNVSSVLFRKEKYFAVGGVDTRYTLCADWDLWIRMCTVGGVGYIDQPLNRYRVHDRTMRRRKTESAENITEALHILDRVQGKTYDRRVKAYYGKLFRAAVMQNPKPGLILRYWTFRFFA